MSKPSGLSAFPSFFSEAPAISTTATSSSTPVEPSPRKGSRPPAVKLPVPPSIQASSPASARKLDVTSPSTARRPSVGFSASPMIDESIKGHRLLVAPPAHHQHKKHSLTTTMSCKHGDHYIIPSPIPFIKIGLSWTHKTASHVDVDASGIYFTSAGKKIDHVSFGRKMTADQSMMHSGDEKGQETFAVDDESILLSLHRISSEVEFVCVLLNVYTTGRSFDDVSNVLARVAEVTPTATSSSAGNSALSVAAFKSANEVNEIMRYPFISTSQKMTGMVYLIIRRRPPNGWKIIAVSVPVAGKTHRHVTTECEGIVQRLNNGWLPVAKGYKTGGELDAHKQMMRRASRKVKSSLYLKKVLSTEELEDLEIGSSSSDGSALSRRSSLPSGADLTTNSLEKELFDTSSSSSSNEDSANPWVKYYRNSGAGPRRVIRKARMHYSVGRPTKPRGGKWKPAFGNHGGEGGSSEDEEDEEVFISFFPSYGCSSVVRYEDRCYNVGSNHDYLMAHYLKRRDDYAEAVAKALDGFTAFGGVEEENYLEEEERGTSGSLGPEGPRNRRKSTIIGKIASEDEAPKVTRKVPTKPKGSQLSAAARKLRKERLRLSRLLAGQMSTALLEQMQEGDGDATWFEGLTVRSRSTHRPDHQRIRNTIQQEVGHTTHKLKLDMAALFGDDLKRWVREFLRQEEEQKHLPLHSPTIYSETRPGSSSPGKRSPPGPPQHLSKSAKPQLVPSWFEQAQTKESSTQPLPMLHANADVALDRENTDDQPLIVTTAPEK